MAITSSAWEPARQKPSGLQRRPRHRVRLSSSLHRSTMYALRSTHSMAIASVSPRTFLPRRLLAPTRAPRACLVARKVASNASRSRSGIGDFLHKNRLISDGRLDCRLPQCGHDLPTQPYRCRRRGRLFPRGFARITAFRQGFLHATHANRLGFIAYVAFAAPSCAAGINSASGVTSIAASGSRRASWSWLIASACRCMRMR